MPNTPLGVTYPAATDALRLAASHMQTLAQSVDGLLALGVIALASTTADSPATTTEARDTATGNAIFTAVAGRTYRVEATGSGVKSTVAGDNIRILIRDGGAATPTSSSPLVAGSSTPVSAAGDGGKSTLTVDATLKCPDDIAAGVHHLSVFVSRASGTGSVSLGASMGGKRQLRVVDEGSAL